MRGRIWKFVFGEERGADPGPDHGLDPLLILATTLALFAKAASTFGAALLFLVLLVYSSTCDIEIAFSGLRPGEKLYEELLIGDNVVECAHPRICQVQEAFLPWAEMSTLLDALDDACQNFKIDELRALLLRAPSVDQFSAVVDILVHI